MLCDRIYFVGMGDFVTVADFFQLLDNHEFYDYWECDTCGDQIENMIGIDEPINWDNEPCGFCQRGHYKRVIL